MRIAVISDSHGFLPEDLDSLLAGADLICHLGDVGPLLLLDELQARAPLLAVQGNNDAPGRPELPPLRRFTLGGLHFHLRHHPWPEHEMRQAEAPSLFLHGHTHRPRIDAVPSGYRLCPGSLRLPRGGFPPCYAWIVLEDGAVRLAIRSTEDRRLLFEEIWTPPGLGKPADTPSS